MHLDRRVVHLRQRRDRQLPIGDDAGEQMPTISSDVATGRRMNRREGFMIAQPSAPQRLPPRAARPHARLELVHAVRDDHLARRRPLSIAVASPSVRPDRDMVRISTVGPP